MFGKVPKFGTAEHPLYPRKRHEKGDLAFTGAGAKTTLSSRVLTMSLMWLGLDFRRVSSRASRSLHLRICI
jgi:hypothetical protein